MRRIFLICIALFCVTLVPGSAQRLDGLHIHVMLHQDGSATLSQRWEAEVVSGTEFYVPVSNLGRMNVSDLKVSESGYDYISEGTTWNVHRNMAEKAGKCGIVKTDSGVELCWGIGGYGRHDWKVSYRVTGMVQSLKDYDAFNFQFVNPGMSAPPRVVSIDIENDFGAVWTDENTREWGFGCDGTVDLEDGIIRMASRSALTRDQYVNLMVRFEKGLFLPTISRDIPFEEMRELAFKGSDYSSDDRADVMILVVLALLAVGFVFFLIFMVVETARGNKYLKSMFGVRKITGWYRQAPLDRNLSAAYYVLRHSNRFLDSGSDIANNVMGAFFLKWIMDGKVSLRPNPSKSGKVNLVFTNPELESTDSQMDLQEAALYSMAFKASGDGVLENNEFKRWSRNNANQIAGWPDRLDSEGFGYLMNNGLMCGNSRATEQGQVELRKLIEFQNFLKDFTLSSQREVTEVGLWKDYLVYAQLFGIADKVAAQFRKLYPETFTQLSGEVGVDPTSLIWYVHHNQMLSRNVYQTARTKMSSSEVGGFGGRTSFGGGGGFSGGGFGGGTR